MNIYSARRTGPSALLEILTGAHQSANCTWLSKFLTWMTRERERERERELFL
jgi:hypothetical protein